MSGQYRNEDADESNGSHKIISKSTVWLVGSTISVIVVQNDEAYPTNSEQETGSEPFQNILAVNSVRHEGNLSSKLRILHKVTTI